MKKFEFIPASRATRNGTNNTSSSGDENVEPPAQTIRKVMGGMGREEKNSCKGKCPKKN